jgi:hypothetical protein
MSTAVVRSFTDEPAVLMTGSECSRSHACVDDASREAGQ